jgi:hypothetical protein
MGNEIYRYYLAKYVELIKGNNVAHPLLFVKDDNGLFKNIGDIEVSLLYPHQVYKVESNHVFRKQFEHLKHRMNSQEHYVFVINDNKLEKKILDFIKRSYQQSIHEMNLKNFLNNIDPSLEWHERINDYSANDIEKIFERLLLYRKSLPKKSIGKSETDEILLSAIYDIDATKLNDTADCYIYYQNILDIYGNNQPVDIELDLQELIISVFKSNNAELIAEFIAEGLFELFDQTLWISLVLKQFNQLTEENLKHILGKDYEKVSSFDFDEFVALAERIERKDKKLYIQKKDQAEKLIRNSEISLYHDAENFVSFVKENQQSASLVIMGIKNVLKEFNLEGIKKLYRYSFNDLKELSRIVESIPYQIESINKTKLFLKEIINLIDRIEFLEANSKHLINNCNTYSQWCQLFSERLYDLEYNLSNIRYELDTESFIDTKRYEALEKRLHNVLNIFRKSFAMFIEENYEKWLEFGAEQPILNKNIPNILPIHSEKICLVIFDGMRYDAWKKVVEPYFRSVMTERDIVYHHTLAMLPSITSISRQAIYEQILSKYRGEVNYITKSESEARQQDVKDSFLMNKRLNILIFNMFDKEGHSSTQGIAVFYKRQREIFEASIKELIACIPEDAHLVITSDHGFMKVNEYLKVEDADQVKPRYVVSANPVPYSIEIDGYKLSYSDKGYFSGGGERELYSHGGVSFEEVILPYIHIKPKRTLTKSQSDSRNRQVNIETSKIPLNVQLTKKEEAILAALSRTNQLTTKDIEMLLLNKFGESGMVDGMMKRLSKKLLRTGNVKIDISAVGEIIVYRLIK